MRAMSDRAHLGPFVLDAPLGRGGMGEVWRATHGGSGLPVAVKVLSGAFTGRRSFQALFQDEVRAVAALDHPGVVRVYDTGFVTGAAAAATRGALSPGSPWLAMELAGRGAIADLPPPTTWE